MTEKAFPEAEVVVTSALNAHGELGLNEIADSSGFNSAGSSSAFRHGCLIAAYDLMPSFFIRFGRVDGGTPKASAVPPLPAINPLVIPKTSEICLFRLRPACTLFPRQSADWSFLNLHPRE